ncbi:hypothetical protein H0H93_005180 [Arthromyces matolae]|nr:hypothetical protein H0H93_005180 [Arthromyces matolae]
MNTFPRYPHYVHTSIPGKRILRKLTLSPTRYLWSLEVGLHVDFGFGDYGLVRLPNFAMTCSDLPSNSTGFVPANRITLVQFVADDNSSRPPPSTGLDARFTFGNKDIKLPSPMLLDFHFGVAFYKRWCIPGSEGAHYLGEFRKEHYESVPVRFTEYLDPGADDDLPVDGGSQDDPSYRPAKSVLGKKRMDQTMDQTMDNLVYLTMALQGLTPKVMADMEERHRKEEQLKRRRKVLSWMEEASPPDSAE